jgi:uncharacterized protein
MPTYLTPGVYIEEIPSSVRPIEAVGTSTAAFVGFARRGPVDRPGLVTSWDQYVERYGGVAPGTPTDLMGHSVNAFFANGGTRAYIARVAQDARPASGSLLHPDTPDRDNPRPQDRLIRFEAADPGTWGDALRVELVARDDGSYDVVVRERAPLPGHPDRLAERERFARLSLTAGDPQFAEGVLSTQSRLVRATLEAAAQRMRGFSESEQLAADFDVTGLNGNTMTVTVDGQARTVAFDDDQFDDTSTLADLATEIQRQVRGSVNANAAVRDFTASAADRTLTLRSGAQTGASAVVVSSAANDDAAAPLHLGEAHGGRELTGAEALAEELAGAGDGLAVTLSGSSDGSVPGSAAAYDRVWSAFLKIRDINTICLPGNVIGTPVGNAVLSAAIGHADAAQRRMVIVDPPQEAELATEAAVGALNLPTSPNSACYYPWVRVANPDYDPDVNPGADPTVLVPPCGFAAGVWSRIDARRGVWKAPAGTEAYALGVQDLRFPVEDAEQTVLNPGGVNAIRRFPAYGTVLWGSRTLATRAQPEWRYVPVRRTAMFIEGSVHDGIQWAVFEPNDDKLWSSLRVNISSFMDGLFRGGAFQGTTAREAYFVRCGLGDTMTQGDIDRGQVIVLVGFAPLKPAEFVIVRIQQAVGQQ